MNTVQIDQHNQMNYCEVIPNNLHCSSCNYTAKDKSNFNKHIKTIKHMNRINQNSDISKQREIYGCEQCSKICKTKQALSNHSKSCSLKQQSIQPQTEKVLLSILEITQNQIKVIELQNEIIEKHNKMIEKQNETIMLLYQQIKELKTPIVQNIYMNIT